MDGHTSKNGIRCFSEKVGAEDVEKEQQDRDFRCGDCEAVDDDGGEGHLPIEVGQSSCSVWSVGGSSLCRMF